MIKGFKDFIARGNVVDLAVAVVIGAAFGAVITSLVDNVINPIIAALFGKPDLSEVLVWTLNDAGTPDPADDAVLAIGAFLTAILNFLIIAAAIYFLVVMPLNKLAERRKKGDEVVEEAGPTEVEVLMEIRDELRTRPRP
ncbi:large conductance mechanosensitive channel protein MscL [Demequina sp. NBRC 110053]|uniref:large conductance mechanosensitive channel protein MscL n=1 Tax=Demequina sp. NBRC 110053 TaxID=1570342 RepID=UPI0009FF3ED6|nr:large conductance mechanosensitive channel protein MscL [Demequina sp. NBRC 110053]